MGALADKFGSFEVVFYTTAAFAALATASATLHWKLKRCERVAEGLKQICDTTVPDRPNFEKNLST